MFLRFSFCVDDSCSFPLSNTGKCHNDRSNYIIFYLFCFLYLRSHAWLYKSLCGPGTGNSERAYLGSPLTSSSHT